MKKVLIIDTIHPAFEAMLNMHGFTFTHGTNLSKEEVISIVHEFEGLVIRSRFQIDKDLILKATNLKFIARAGAGMENIDTDFANQKKIACINAPEANRIAVGEHALGMLLSLFNKLNVADSEVRRGIWKREENRGKELSGKTIGIIGFGNMGSAFASLLMGFNCKILVYDKYIKVNKTIYSYVEQVDIENIFAETDVLSLHVPLTAETLFMVNKSFLESFRKTITIINTARGKILKTEDLVDVMKKGKVSGACLDVIEYEGISFEQLVADQLPDAWNYLVKSEQVMLSPHIAGWSYESHEKISVLMAEKVLKLYHDK